MIEANQQASWMTPEEALSRFKNEEMSLLDLEFSSRDESEIRYGYCFDGVGFLVGEGILSEIINDYTIYPMPNCASWMTGLVNVRGNLVPVYDLKELFGLKTSRVDATSKDYKHLLVLDKGTDSVAVLIYELPLALNIVNWNASDHKPELANCFSKYITSSYLDDSIIWVDFDHKKYFKSIRNLISV